MKIYAWILSFSLLALFTHGYSYGVSDQEIFIPYILNNYDPTLFSNDKLLFQESSKASIFYPAMALLLNFASLETIFFIGFVLWQVAFFWVLYHLARVILKDERLALFSILLYLAPKFIGGTATQTFDSFFGYRSIGIILLLIAIRYLLENKVLKASLLTSVNLFIHPLSVIPLLGYFPASVTKKNLVSVSLAIFFIVFTIIAVNKIADINATARLNHFWDRNWLSIIKQRNNFLFLENWSIYGWGSFAIYFLPIVIFYNKLEVKIKKILFRFFLASLLIFVGNLIFLEVFKSPFFTNLQLVRSFNPLAYIGLAMTAFFLTGRDGIQKVIGVITFIAIATNQFYIYLIFASIFFITDATNFFKKNPTVKPKLISRNIILPILLFVTFYWLVINFRTNNVQKVIQYPKPQSEWINVQNWANENTNKNDIFLSDPYLTGFRIFSKRSIVGDIKDGGVNIYSAEFAKNWHQVMQDTNNLKSLNGEDINSLQKKYQFKYLVTTKDQIIGLPIVYSNSKFIVYLVDFKN